MTTIQQINYAVLLATEASRLSELGFSLDAGDGVNYRSQSVATDGKPALRVSYELEAKLDLSQEAYSVISEQLSCWAESQCQLTCGLDSFVLALVGQKGGRDTYWSDEQLAVVVQGIGLRERAQVGGGHRLTLKLPPPTTACPRFVGRTEIELRTHVTLQDICERRADSPEGQHFGRCVEDVVSRLCPVRALRPVVDVQTKRNNFAVLRQPADESRIATISVDAVTAVSGGRTVSFYELEIEAQPTLPIQEQITILDALVQHDAFCSFRASAGSKVQRSAELLRNPTLLNA